MAIVVWTFLALLGTLLIWEAAARLRRRRPGSPTDCGRYYAPEVERRREAAAAASSTDHASAVGLRARVAPRR